VREIRLHDGFDELGLERLASVTHSSFVALIEGGEGVEREQAERELGAAGVAAGAPAPAPPPTLPAPPLALPPPAPRHKPDVPANVTARAEPRAAPPPTALLLLGAGYGIRLRGAEGVGHGPSLTFGVQSRRASVAYDLQLSGQYLLRSRFEAKPFDASVQTTALRFQFGVESRLTASWLLQALVGLGADFARISARAASASDNAATRVSPRAKGTQWRGGGELALGVWRRFARLDLGVLLHATSAFQDVRYDAMTSDGETLLVRPWLVQPALSIQGRFRSVR
jgi:hypothetical protein